MFYNTAEKSSQELALTAVGLQMAIEITRHLDYAIRWSVNVEIHMVSVQRLLQYAKLCLEQVDENHTGSVSIQGKV